MTPSPTTPLTDKQAQVARLIQKGHSYSTIGTILGITYSAVLTRANEAAKKWPDKRHPKVKLMEWREG